jgi:4'-phosphopantetheinyl transferase
VTAKGASAEAEIWFAWVGDHAGDVDRFSRDCLSAEERERLVIYRTRELAERYVVTRSLVRIVLSDRLGVSARDLRVNRTDTGKPVVAGDGGLHFNVSHSGDLILLALSERRAVGVDVERRREVQRVQSLRSRWLSEPERDQMDRLIRAGASASDAFLRVWSLKEAKLKALGVGISGAGDVALETIEAQPLDALLGILVPPRSEGYVGALAFA